MPKPRQQALQVFCVVAQRTVHLQAWGGGAKGGGCTAKGEGGSRGWGLGHGWQDCGF